MVWMLWINIWNQNSKNRKEWCKHPMMRWGNFLSSYILFLFIVYYLTSMYHIFRHYHLFPLLDTLFQSSFLYFTSFLSFLLLHFSLFSSSLHSPVLIPHFFFFASIAFQLSNMREENVLQIAALKDAIDSTNLGER